MNRTARRFALPAILLAGAVTLTACGGSESDTTAGSSDSGHDMSTMDSSPTPSATATPATGPHNATDVAFATGMIPHHRQAVEMAQMAVEKATNTEVKKLAAGIQAAQDPEIVQLSGWLTGWGEPVPDASMSGMDMDDMDMSGMMSEQEMTRLEESTGTEFDRMWLTMMVEHHEGAVAMSKIELRDGQNADAEALAQDIIAGQGKEIATMTRLLRAL